MEDLGPVTSFEKFQEYYKVYKEAAHKLFLELKRAPHLVYPLRPDGYFTFVHFDELMRTVETLRPDATTRQHKGMVYRSVAEGMRLEKAIGYIQMCEGWSLSTESEYGHQKLVEQYPDFSKAPGVREALMLSWRYKDKAAMDSWQIKRMGDEIFLVEERTLSLSGTKGNQSMVDQVVLENTK